MRSDHAPSPTFDPAGRPTTGGYRGRFTRIGWTARNGVVARIAGDRVVPRFDPTPTPAA